MVYPLALVESILKQPRIEARFFGPNLRANPTLEIHVYDRPLGSSAWHVGVQMADVRKARMDDLVRWRLPVAVVVVGDHQLEIQAPRAGLHPSALEVVVRVHGELLDEPIV